MAKKRKSAKKTAKFELINYVYIVIVVAVSLITIFKTGILGEYLAKIAEFLFGTYYVAFFAICIIGCIWAVVKQIPIKLMSIRGLGGSFLLIGVLLFLAIPSDKAVGQEAFDNYLLVIRNILDGVATPLHGGIIGALIYVLTSSLIDITGTWIVIASLIVIGLILIIDWKNLPKFEFNLKEKISGIFSYDDSQGDEYEEEFDDSDNYSEQELLTIGSSSKEVEPKFIDYNTNQQRDTESKEEFEDTDSEASTVVETAKYDEYSNYRLPAIGRMLERNLAVKSKQNELVAKTKGKRLVEIFEQFQTVVQLQDIYVGPSVTKFVVKPDLGVKVNKITALQDDIKMGLAAKSIRIEAPIPGRNGVGIEIPNAEITPVKMREVFETIPDSYASKKLLVVLGKDLFGNPVFCELNEMPHLLIAGATGSGKSVCMNSIICSLLLRTTPAELKLVLIDPKKVEFTQYHHVPHLIAPVISDSNKAASALDTIVNKMDERYNKFSSLGVRNIAEFNEYARKNPDKEKHMPFVVVIIDELADLMSVAGKEVESKIQRITQLARAAGIHLIVATQRPSTDVITGIIKTNIPSRIAFAVSSGIDSRTIIDQVGAERLLGNGDMLYTPLGEPVPMRVQGVYVSNAEIDNITKYVSNQAKPFFEDEFINTASEEYTGGNPSSVDPMYDEVVKFVVTEQIASTSLLQRRFGFGYNRAARIVDMLQQEGIVGPARGSKPREVFVKKIEE